ncbi:MAG TPA: terminase small subunit [Myxococcota bacterium]|nr:terminase small subunit [Myxococcota bacterium]
MTADLRATADAALSALTDQQRAFAIAYATHGDPLRAAEAAGYSGASLSDMARRTRRNERVQAAVRALTAMRSADVSYDAEGLRRVLEGMLAVSTEDFLTRNTNGDVIGIKDQSLLSPAERARVKKLEARIRRSAKGERSHLVNLTVELVPALDIVRELARIGGYYADAEGPALSVNVAASTRSSSAPTLDPLLAELADVLLDDRELRRFVAASDSEKVALLRAGIARLREAA